jgi:WD40 repeat protein
MVGWDTRSISTVVFFADGKTLAAGDTPGAIRLWNLQSNPATPIATLSEHKVGLASLAVAPDGVHFASSDNDGFVKLWLQGKTTSIATAHPSATTARDICFDSTGRILASAHTDGSIWILDAATLKPLRELRGHQGAVNGIVFQPNSTRLASGGVDRTVRIWDVISGTQILTLHGHRRPIQRLAFSADGATLASTSLDGTVQLWDSQP